MSVTAVFLSALEDGTAIYRLVLIDPEHLIEPVVVEAHTFEGDIFLVEKQEQE